ncbi:MAG: DUF3592 domain-containing protein [Acidobacteriia bacterium]|nr:DUF3592 domain-containing protein [Terriglobia bacterium]
MAVYEDRIARFFARVVVRFIYMIPAAVFYFLVYLGRRIRRWYVAGRALNWPAADATVRGSYELDENEVPFSRNGWGEEETEGNKYYPRWAVALQYGYEAAGEFYSGTYFLPATYSDGDLAFQAKKAWAGKTIVVRYNPSHPSQSFFLEQDGAPGKPHIPRLLSYQPYLTDLSLK